MHSCAELIRQNVEPAECKGDYIQLEWSGNSCCSFAWQEIVAAAAAVGGGNTLREKIELHI